jgi:CHASE2 domain-containing sensor protein
MANKLVVLKLDGDFQQGYQATLEISEDGKRPSIDLKGYLPANPELPKACDRWRTSYRSLGGRNRVKFKSGLTNVSFIDLRENCVKAADDLHDRFATWLQADSFRPIKEKCLEWLSPDDQVRLIIRTACRQLPRLPWQQWDLVERYDKLEVAMSLPSSEDRRAAKSILTPTKVRILAILGNREGIDVEKDLQALQSLKGADVTFLDEPSRQEINDQLWEQHWDILFFSGHSETQDQKGVIHINPQESLAIADLKEGLKKAIRQGLHLAVFNSCDGLGLAWELQSLQIAQLIVMREPVPDAVAHQFLQYLMPAYAAGDSLYQAVSGARKQLQGLEDKYPFASWLPLIVQNAATLPPTWHALRYGNPSARRRRILGFALGASVLVTALLVAVRQQGILQPLELKAYDQLMRWRPSEKPDERILLVTITDQDVKAQDPIHRRDRSLSDSTLTQLLEKLEQYKPRVIGLDIYRETPVDSQFKDLAKRIQHNDRLIGVCYIGATEKGSIPPPPGIPSERLGFSDTLPDEDNTIRRHLLGASSGVSKCQTTYSLSLTIAEKYLAGEGQQLQKTLEDEIQIGNTVFKTLDKDSGGYQKLDARGFQMMLNYRSSMQVAPTVTLTEVLTHKIPPENIRDRIILIGSVAEQFPDYHATPYSIQTPGVVIQAHMVSQIISAVQDGRQLITSWSQTGAILWIWGWSLLGGLLVWRFRSVQGLGVAVVAATILLSGLCYVFLLQGLWVPLVPSILVLLVVTATVAAYQKYLK